MTTIKLYSEYCRKLVKAHDYDRYLISLSARKEDQKYLWALFAFNYEIAKTKEVVTEDQIGLIRLKWWRDEIEKIYNDSPYKDNQILPVLASAIKEKGLDKDVFDSLIDARAHDFSDKPYDDIDSLISYADCTNTPLLILTSKICDIDTDFSSLTHLGIAYGLAGLMISAPYRKKDLVSDNIQEIADESNRSLDVFTYDIIPQPLKSISKITKLNLLHIKNCGYNSSHKNYTKPVFLKALRVFI